MDVKKSCKADLKNKRILLSGISVVVALVMVVAVFSCAPRERRIAQTDLTCTPAEADTVAVTLSDELKPAHAAESEPIKPVVRSAGGRKQTRQTDPLETDSLVEIVVLSRVEEEWLDDDYHVDPPPESLPRFEGGDLDEFRIWVQKNVTFPRIALEDGIQGRVVLSFVVSRDGTLTDIEVLRTPHRSLADEAVRVLNKSPKWAPGKIGGKTVPVKFVLPVDFRMLN